MKYFTLIFMLLAGLMITVSCKKDDDSSPVTPADTTHHDTIQPQNLTTRNWKMIAGTLEPGILGQTNAFAVLDTCLTDDIYMFRSDSVFTQDEGLTKCNGGDSQTRLQGTWTYSNADTVLTVVPNDGSAPIRYKVESVTQTRLRANTAYRDPVFGTSQILHQTFQAQ